MTIKVTYHLLRPKTGNGPVKAWCGKFSGMPTDRPRQYRRASDSILFYAVTPEDSIGCTCGTCYAIVRKANGLKYGRENE